MAEQQIEITQVRSAIGRQQAQRRTLRALGLRRRHHTVSQPDRPEIRGMISRVAHLVEVRYPGVEEALDIQPGQEPKGAGRPAAGAAVGDEEVVELRAAEAEALSEPGSTPLTDLVENPAGLESVENPDRPKAAPTEPAQAEDSGEEPGEVPGEASEESEDTTT